MKELEEIQTEFTALSDFLIALGDEKRQAIIIALLEDITSIMPGRKQA